MSGVSRRQVPALGAWVHSAAFDGEVTEGAYTGAFFLSAASGLVYFDTVNPEVR